VEATGQPRARGSAPQRLAVAWRAQPAKPGGGATEAADWLLLGTGDGLAAAMAARLPANARCDVLPDGAADTAALDAALARATGRPLRILHLASLDDQCGDTPMAAQERGSLDLHRLAAALGRHSPARAIDLSVVARGSQSVLPGEGPANPQHAPLLAMALTILAETTWLVGRAIDLSPLPDPAAEATLVLGEIGGGETRVAWREGGRFVARLEHRQAPARFVARQAAAMRLDTIGLEPASAPDCGDDEVVVRVHATALNLRDVLRALRMLDAGRDGFGFEAAGVVEQVGRAVHGVAVGERVLAVLCEGALASHVAVPARWIRAIPAALSSTQAAALPLAMLTALHALETLGGIMPGQRVLIHAAAGGVGQAAVQIAHAAGASVIATASPAKWDHLRRAGIGHIASSRDTSFVETARRASDGQGADIVLNALNGAFIPASLEACRTGGTFIEIGRIGAWTAAQVAAVRPDIRYLTFDLKQVALDDPAGFAVLFDGMMRRLAAGQLKPLAGTTFDVGQSEAAFRFLAAGRNIGKVVLTQPDAGRPPRLRGDACYVLAGGTGALGRAVAERLVAWGAGDVVLLGRHLPAELAGDGPIRAIACDITDAAAVADAFAALAHAGHRISGVMHLAGVLEDGLLTTRSEAAVRRVLAPKLAGAWALQRACTTLELDFFVLFSSVAALLGGAGQGAYAAANAYLDALAQARRAQKLPGCSIAWGPWAGIGMAARLDAAAQARIERLGLRPISPEAALRALGSVLNEQGHVVLADADWPHLATSLARAGDRLLDARATAVPSLALPKAPAPAPTAPALPDLLAAEVRTVLGLPADFAILPDDKLFDLGLDSLLAVELSSRLEILCGRRLGATLLFNHPTMAALAQHLGEQAAPGPPRMPADDTMTQGEAALRADIAAMSDEQAERELRDALAALAATVD